MIVVDVGCKGFETEESVARLAAAYEPELLLGFDPHPMLAEETYWEGDDERRHMTLVVARRAAAWTHDGHIGYLENGTRSRVAAYNEPDAKTVDCIDLARLIKTLPAVEIIVKLDCEGAEYTLLPHLLAWGALQRVSLLLVEWHDPEAQNGTRESLLRVLPCEVRDW